VPCSVGDAPFIGVVQPVSTISVLLSSISSPSNLFCNFSGNTFTEPLICMVRVGEEHTSATNHTNTKQPSNWLACLQQWAGSGQWCLRSLLLQNTQRITSSDRIATVELLWVQWYWFQGMTRPQTIHKIQQTKAIPIVPQTSIQNTNGSNPVKLAINPWFQWVSELLTSHSAFTTILVD